MSLRDRLTRRSNGVAAPEAPAPAVDLPPAQPGSNYTPIRSTPVPRTTATAPSSGMYGRKIEVEPVSAVDQVKIDLHKKLIERLDLEALLSLEREVRVASRLSHPNILPVFDSGSADKMLYYVMPFVQGESLRERLSRGSVGLDDAVSLLRDIARALGDAEAAAIGADPELVEPVVAPLGDELRKRADELFAAVSAEASAPDEGSQSPPVNESRPASTAR